MSRIPTDLIPWKLFYHHRAVGRRDRSRPLKRLKDLDGGDGVDDDDDDDNDDDVISFIYMSVCMDVPVASA
jgi:hypothetical protein